MAGPDLLADKLLAQGDPDEDEVRRAAPPMNSFTDDTEPELPSQLEYVRRHARVQGHDACLPQRQHPHLSPRAVLPGTHPGRANTRYEGLVGGWMPAVRKVLPGDDGSHYEMVVFGDVLAKDRFIVQTWHRTAHIQNGKIVRVEYGYSYPAYTRRRQEPKPEDFFRALLIFAEYWEHQIEDMSPLTLPDQAGRTWRATPS